MNLPKSLSVVVPVYNEEQTVETLVRQVAAIPNLLEIIVVDDCSTDNTPAILDRLREAISVVRLERHTRNQGKTAALRTGFVLTPGDGLSVQDADLEYDPTEIAEVVAPIQQGKADVVYGSRFLVRRATRVVYFYHYLFNRGITFLSNVFTNLNMTDVETCYKAFRGEIIRNMIIRSRGFGFEIEVTAKMAKLRCRVYEVPISYYGRTYEEGKKITAIDGVWAFFYVFRYNLLAGMRSSFRRVPDLGPDAASSREGAPLPVSARD